MGAIKYDFSGWATKNDMKCSDGRTIRRDAFKDNDGTTVPLVWNHRHDDPSNVLGHALLENRNEGVYAYCTFNDTENGESAKKMVAHGDIVSLSIYANRLKQNGADVIHGAIREVSLVLAGANPGAKIDTVLAHGDGSDEDVGIIWAGQDIELYHAEEKEEKETEMAEEAKSEKTVKDVIDSMTEEQKKVMYAMIGMALEEAGKNENKEGETEMKHNVFEGESNEKYMARAAFEQAVLSDAKRFGSYKESFLAHSEELMHADGDDEQTYGIEDIDLLFPDEHAVNNEPGFIKRDMDWVGVVMNGVKHTPFSRLKSIYANITGEDARAKGYVKGNQKTEEVFGLLKRTTSPTTVYKKQKMDRDDVIDITSFDVIAWLKREMRMMLDEEIARAILVGDGRLSASDDKINESCIRPIWKDDATLYTINQKVVVTATATDDEVAHEFIRQAVKARKNYKGSGNPTLFTTEDVLTDCLLMEDLNGHRLYKDANELATAMRVSKIVTVPVMENQERTVSGEDRELMGIIVNLADYTVGADKGGQVALFDDFDIDVNQQKYLIETRCSGSLMVPYSAIVLEKVEADED